ncbi:DUF5050 domain-containing protein [Clostridium algidicarnis]|uniref:DUF5050 domain-containing protein n=1 Tax=Clostridium algidicarnis TaxID=37659 RepID=UPI001C0C2DC2|nr:DUF5050 domain-containing protein [Clostridium algidicarnis]MBU3209280.1 DUF5050 domain-containing protein [Clostridium algidicarnis]MBU3227995.1 DUF5050 domain-containing protein [Clostridium algidicarnis]MBU3251834.1 DUF5050 domain-containing protein [Clostridium algidicarnis]
MQGKTNFKMLKISVLTFFISIMTITILNVVPAKAATDYKVIDPKYSVEPNHEFKVKLSQEVDETNLKNGDIKVYEKDTLKGIDIILKKDPNNPRNVMVKGRSPFINGKTYTIEVVNLKSKKNKNLKNLVKMDFTVRNIYSGLPGEEGLIIVDDKAYSIDYLTKNIKMVNEILLKSYDIYYTYNFKYEKIYSLFKSAPVNGSNLTRKYDEMIYIDSNGDKHIYEWRKDRQEYNLVPPKAKVDIIVRSEAKATNVTLKDVKAVPDAKYYKLRGSNLIKTFGESIMYFSTGNYEEVSILSSDKTVLATGLIDVSKDNVGEVRLRLSKGNHEGNSGGNSNNNGIAVEDKEGYIYYVNNADKEKVYKIGADGGFDRMILEDKAQYLNESGDWIYYSNYNDEGKMYKVKKDGTERQKILDDKSAYINISGEDIYYSNHTNGGKLYRIKKDGSDVKVSATNTLHGNQVVVDYGGVNSISDEVAYINISGDWIYYSNYSDGHKPYVIHKDGTYRGKISDVWADSSQVVGDWVYLTSGNGTISKVNKSGQGPVIPINGKTTKFEKGYHINVFEDWIYYSNAEDGGKLYKVSTDGSNKKIKLSDEPVGYINIVGDFIYFTTTKGKLFKLPLNSNGNIAPEEVGKPKDSNLIAEIKDVNITVGFEDVNQSTEFLEEKYLPNKVPAIMKDNTIQQLVVIWDTTPSKVSFTNGVRTYTGRVVGYNKTIKLFMTIPSEMLNDTNKITTYKNGNKNDMVIVEEIKGPTDSNKIKARLQEGDTIKVYSDMNKLKLLGSSNVGRDGKAVITRLDLDPYGKSAFITITRKTKAESSITEVKQYITPTIRMGDVKDKDFVGVGLDLRDLTIDLWTVPFFNRFDVSSLNQYYNIHGQEIYVVPARTALDMNSYTPFVDKLSKETMKWDGSTLSKEEAKYKNKDSKGTLLKNGSYDVYVSSTFDGKASPDIDGNMPLVEGKVANNMAGNYTMVSEQIPAKPTIKEQKVQGHDPSKQNIWVNLDKPLNPGEEAFLVPKELLDQVRNWNSEMGPSPFEKLLNENYDIVKFKGLGTKIPSPEGDKSTTNPKDKDYKLFVVNGVGGSVESDNKITVDNSAPKIGLDKSGEKPTYDVGDPIAVRVNEKSKTYIVKWGIDRNPSALEEAFKSQNALMIQHRGSNISIPLFKSETLVDFTNVIGSSLTESYYAIAVDEAGNISNYEEITIRRDFKPLLDVLNDARQKESPSKELLAAIKKAEQLLIKNNVKQSEIRLIVDEIQTMIGRLSNDTTLSSNDSSIIVDNKVILTSQMSVTEFMSSIITKNNSKAMILGEDGNATASPDLVSGMKVRVIAQDGKTTQDYQIKVVIASPKDGADLIKAINDKYIEIINLSPNTYKIDANTNISRNITIKGSTLGVSKIEFVSQGKITVDVASQLKVSRTDFIGNASGHSDNIIENNGKLIIDNDSFSSFEFKEDGKSVIKSNSGSNLIVTGTRFSNIKSSGKEFSYIYIDEGVSEGTKVEDSTFLGMTTGKNVTGIKISGNTSNYNEILINKNTFNNFKSDIVGSISIPIYVDGGRVNISSNIISGSEVGIWLESTRAKVQVGAYTLGSNGLNSDKIGPLIYNINRNINNNHYGDIVIGKTIEKDAPEIYYNSTATPTIGLISIKKESPNEIKLDIKDKASTGNKYVYQVNSVLIDTPRVGVVMEGKPYVDKDAPIALDTQDKYIVIAEVNSVTNKIVRFRQIYIP